MKEGRIYSASGLGVQTMRTGKAPQQEHEVVGHAAPTVRELVSKRGQDACAQLVLSSFLLLSNIPTRGYTTLEFYNMGPL